MTTVESTAQDRGAAFEERLVGMLNDGATGLMTSIGHRTGLFDAMSGAGPLTIEQLADRAGLQPRYVQEWLGAMTCSRIVEHDPGAATYTLPDAHAPLLTRGSVADNLAVFAQYLGMLGAVEDDVVACFREGGGVPYERFPRFQEIMEEDSSQTVLAVLREHILGLVPGLVDRLEAGIRVLDVGCGRGRALNELAGWFPESTFLGVDLSEQAIDYARRTAAARGWDNVVFEVGDATRLTDLVGTGRVDLALTFDAVHDQADPAAMVRGIHDVLDEGGVYVAQDIDASSNHHDDIDHPLGPLLYTISCMHCMTVSLARDGAGLGAMWGRQRALALFGGAGFTDVEVHTLEHDPQNAYYVCRPSAG